MKYLKLIRYTLLSIGILVLIVFAKNINLAEIVDIIKQSGFQVIFYAFAIVLINILIKAIRWKILVKKTAHKDISITFSFLSIFAGVASGSIFPGRNEVTKPLLLKSAYKANLSNTIPAALIEKILDLTGLLTLFFVALIFVKFNGFDNFLLMFSLLGILLILFLYVFPNLASKIISIIIKKLPFSQKLKERLFNINQQFFNSFSVIKDKNTLLSLYSLSVLAMCLEALRIFYIFLALGVPISIFTAAIGFTVAALIAVVSLIPGGVGITEFSLATIIGSHLVNSPTNKIMSIVLLNRILAYYLVILIGTLILILPIKILKRKKEEIIKT